MEKRTPEEADFTMESEQTFRLGVAKVNRDKRNKNRQYQNKGAIMKKKT